MKRLICAALALAILAGCKTQQPAPTPPPLPMPAPQVTHLTAEAAMMMATRKLNYAMTWTMPYSLPQSGLSFEVWQSNKLSNYTWEIWLVTNQPPVPLARNQPQQFFKVRALQNGLYSGWAIQGGQSTTNAPAVVSNTVDTVTLAWTASTATNVVAYNLYQWMSGRGTNEIWLGNVQQATVPGIMAGTTNFFAVSALNSQGLESALSSVLQWIAPASGVTNYPPPTPSNLAVFTQ